MATSEEGLSVVLHPLVLVTMTDHALRARAARAPGAAADPVADPVVGVLFGVTSGRRVEIFTSFEAKVDAGVVDAAFVKDKVTLSAHARARAHACRAVPSAAAPPHSPDVRSCARHLPPAPRSDGRLSHVRDGGLVRGD
jgi:hypothetical protein